MVNSLSDSTAPFGYVNGDNPLRDVVTRFDANALTFASTPSSKVSSTIQIGTSVVTVNTQLVSFIPAGSLVTSLGIFFTENAQAGSAGVLSVGFGDASADVSIVASTGLNAAGEDITINSFTSTSSKHALTGSGAAIAFAAGSALYFGNASDLWFQTIVSGNVLDATSEVKIVMEYIKTTNV